MRSGCRKAGRVESQSGIGRRPTISAEDAEDAEPRDISDQRNSTSGMMVLTDDGPLTLDVPRDARGRRSSQHVLDSMLALYL